MIKLKRSDKFAIHLKFSLDDIENLINFFSQALSDQEKKLDIEYNKNVFYRKNVFKNGIFFVRKSNDELLTFKDNQVILHLEEDTIKYTINKLNECISIKDFFPAEVTEIKILNKNNDLYFILETDIFK